MTSWFLTSFGVLVNETPASDILLITLICGRKGKKTQDLNKDKVPVKEALIFWLQFLSSLGIEPRLASSIDVRRGRRGESNAFTISQYMETHHQKSFIHVC